MTDPKLKSARVKIAYRADDGYSYDATFTRVASAPHAPLLDAFAELSRILHLFGHGDEAMRLALDAKVRIEEWRATIPSGASQ